jgi:hypothetical protein
VAGLHVDRDRRHRVPRAAPAREPFLALARQLDAAKLRARARRRPNPRTPSETSWDRAAAASPRC